MLFQPFFYEASTSAVYAFTQACAPRPIVESHPKASEVLSIRPQKRFRSKDDVDGESSSNMQCKKRKLRRDLVTSRLSKPYAQPTTYISGHSGKKLVSCTRTSGTTRIIMRKAALLNWTRQRVKNKEDWPRDSAVSPNSRIGLENARETPSTIHSACRSSSNLTTATFVPLGLSNYEALDVDGDFFLDDPWVDVEEEIHGDVDQHQNRGLDEAEDSVEQPEPRFEGLRRDAIAAQAIASTLIEVAEAREISPAIISDHGLDVGDRPLVFLHPRIATTL